MASVWHWNFFRIKIAKLTKEATKINLSTHNNASSHLSTDWDEDLSILSAENVYFGVETAGLGSRLAAMVVDVTLQLAVLLLFAIALNYTIGVVPDETVFSKGVRSGFEGLKILIAFLIFYGYFFFFEWLWDGQTPGKRATGLRVLQTDGSPVTLWPALVRNLLRIVDFLPIFYGVGTLTALMNDQNRRAGDIIAGTLVAREKRDATKEVLDIGDAVEAFLSSLGVAPEKEGEYSRTEQYSVQENLTPTVSPEAAALRARLSEQEYELARDFLHRREKLSPVARERLAHTVAARLAARLGHEMPANLAEAEALLEGVTALWQRA